MYLELNSVASKGIFQMHLNEIASLQIPYLLKTLTVRNK